MVAMETEYAFGTMNVLATLDTVALTVPHAQIHITDLVVLFDVSHALPVIAITLLEFAFVQRIVLVLFAIDALMVFI